jgi:hypothetical protein
MRFMILRKSDQNTESERLPGREMLAAMGKYADDMTKAGVLLGGDGLLQSAKGSRIKLSKGKLSVTDGPFTEAKELIAGYVLVEVKSKEEAISWAMQCPTLCGDAEAEIEVRQVIEASDFPPELTPELSNMPWTTVATAASQRLRAQLAEKA